MLAEHSTIIIPMDSYNEQRNGLRTGRLRLKLTTCYYDI